MTGGASHTPSNKRILFIWHPLGIKTVPCTLLEKQSTRLKDNKHKQIINEEEIPEEVVVVDKKR